jgi:uncharacterized protein
VQYLRQGDRVQLRYLNGEQFAAQLLEWLDGQGIGFAALTGLGAVSAATVSYWNAQTKQYEQHQLDEQMEVVSLVGNVTIRDGKPFIHAHVSLGRRDLSVVGGHVNELSVRPTLEVWLRPETEAVHRALDESCGLYVMQLPNEA